MLGRKWSSGVVMIGGVALVGAIGLGVWAFRPGDVAVAPAPPPGPIAPPEPASTNPPTPAIAQATPASKPEAPVRPTTPEIRSQAVPTRPFRVWAIVIGIDRYAGNIPATSHAREDAGAIAGWFRGIAKWGPDHILVLDDDGGPIPRDPRAIAPRAIKATRAAMDWAFNGWLRSRLEEDQAGDDIVVVYYAGQAVTVPAGGQGEARPATLLLPVDARLGNPRDPASLENGWDLAKAIDDLPVPSRNAVICWLDTSPQGRGKTVGQWERGKDSDAEAARAWIDGLRRWQGVSAWLASARGPSADGTPDGKGPGPFVLALADGLGNQQSPRSLEECYQALHRTRAPEGFVQAGGFPRDLFLWQKPLVQKARLREPVLQRGHIKEVTAVAVTPAGELITGGGNADSTVKVWSRTSLRVVQEYAGGHLGGIRGLGVLRPGGQDRPLRLLSADNQGKLVVQNLDPGLPPESRALRYDGKRIVSLAVAPSLRSAWVLDDARQVWSIGFDASGEPTIVRVAAGPARALVAAPPRPDLDAPKGPGAAAPRWDFALRLADGTVQLRAEAPGDKPILSIPSPLSDEDALPLIAADPRRGDWIATADNRSDDLRVHRLTPAGVEEIRFALRDLAPGTVRGLQAGPGGRVAVALAGSTPKSGRVLIQDVSAAGAKATVLPPDYGNPPRGRDGLVGQGMAFSLDGRFFATIVPPRKVICWDLGKPGTAPQELPPFREEPGAFPESYVGLSFQAANGANVLHGLRAGGGITRWLSPGLGTFEPTNFAGRSAGIATLSAARSTARKPAGPGADNRPVPRVGPHLLQISGDGRAGVWAINRPDNPFRSIGKASSPVRYHAGAAWTRPDSTAPGAEVSSLALSSPETAAIELREADQPDRVVARFTLPGGPAAAIRPGGGLKLPERLGEVRVSDDGRWLAAVGQSETQGAGAWAFVWDVDRPGPPRFVVSPDDAPQGEQPLERIDLAAAGGELRLLTVASGRGDGPEGNAATLWALDPKGPQAGGVARAVKRAVFHVGDHREGSASRINVARMLPADPNWVALGTSNGRVELVDARKPGEVAVLAGLSDRVDVHDLAFAASGDAAFLAAAGDNAEVLFWEVEGNPARRELRPVADPSRGVTRGRQHVEAVLSLAAAPGDAPGEVRFLSGGHDGTVRFWKVQGKAAGLEATVMAIPSPGGDEWVAFAPSGHVDGSPRGLDQVTLALGDRVRSLDNLAEAAREPGLLGSLLGDPAGRDAQAVDLSGRAPEIRVEHAKPKVGPEPKTELKVSLRAADLKGLAGVRLYHNGVPIDDGLLGKFQGLGKAGPGRLTLTVPVALRSGKNAFHALAYRTDWQSAAAPAPEARAGLDGSSEPVVVDFDGPDKPGATHVVAIGVGNYKAEHRRLAYAADDAKAVRAFFSGRLAPLDPKAKPGSDPNARNTYHTILDGEVTHAAVEKAFRAVQSAVADHPEDSVIVFLAGHADRVDQRRYALLLSDFPFPPKGENAPRTGPGQELSGAHRRNVLEYFRVYGWLTNLAALNRMVIVDACEAERIEDDPGVRAIRADLARTSIRARTVNLLAARRGEPASESSELRHGLLTYALLRGLDAPGLESPPPGLPDLLKNANNDGDEFITAEELRDYTAAAIPKLSASYPKLVQRGNADGSPVPDQRASLSAPRNESGGFAVIKLKK